MDEKVGSWYIGIAAEAFAAGLFARIGYKVSVQYGADQPEYDLLVEKNHEVIMVSVKGSQTGSWGLIQSYKKGNTYHQAADLWANNQSAKIVYCLVQFKGTSIVDMPRVYLARPYEIAQQLKKSRDGKGHTKLYENHTFRQGVGSGSTVKLPEHWAFSSARIEHIIGEINKQT